MPYDTDPYLRLREPMRPPPPPADPVAAPGWVPRLNGAPEQVPYRYRGLGYDILAAQLADEPGPHWHLSDACWEERCWECTARDCLDGCHD